MSATSTLRPNSWLGRCSAATDTTGLVAVNTVTIDGDTVLFTGSQGGANCQQSDVNQHLDEAQQIISVHGKQHRIEETATHQGVQQPLQQQPLQPCSVCSGARGPKITSTDH
jgi:hypothetical protein